SATRASAGEIKVSLSKSPTQAKLEEKIAPKNQAGNHRSLTHTEMVAAGIHRMPGFLGRCGYILLDNYNIFKTFIQLKICLKANFIMIFFAFR
ncbi:MAG TPA: hypothetical protein PKZ83_05600, partial [bacterium]|nr:hypothetical protein [bacterium]HQJ64680.1 hypothetical protein [bacterium]